MKKSRLIELLSSASEEYVAIEMDGQLYGIAAELGHEDEQFDGFDTAYPANRTETDWWRSTMTGKKSGASTVCAL